MELGFLSDVLREVKELHKIGLVSNATFDTLRNKATLLSFNVCEPETNKLEKRAIVTIISTALVTARGSDSRTDTRQ